MHLTRGERWALLLYALVVTGFMPPVIVWANSVKARVLGMPFLLAWCGLMVLVTAIVMSVAFVVKRKVDG